MRRAKCVWCLLALGTVLAAQGAPPARQTPASRAFKVYISADMEGITGVVTPLQLGPEGAEYARFRKFMTDEVNAAVDAATAAGATEIVVSDSHGNGQNILVEDLPPLVKLVRGFPRPLEMMQGIDDSFQAVMFVGYHASESVPNAVRGHTFSSARLLPVKINGQEVSEGIFNAAVAGHFGVPVVFISGGRAAVTQLQKAIPGVEGAIVKEDIGYHSTMTLTPAQGGELIREGARRALARRSEIHAYRVTEPLELEVGFKLTLDAERMAFLPGVTRVDAHTIRARLNDMVQATGFINVATSLAAP